LRKRDHGAVASPDKGLAGRDGVLSRTHCCPRPLTSSVRCAERSSGIVPSSRSGMAGGFPVGAWRRSSAVLPLSAAARAGSMRKGQFTHGVVSLSPPRTYR
jgi:hypothetical protein